MRPIDADLLQEQVHDMFQNVRGHRLVMDIVKQTESVISELIAEQETLEHKQKKKKWKWIETEFLGVRALECSYCKRNIPYLWSCAYKYCPNCGSRMEGGARANEND